MAFSFVFFFDIIPIAVECRWCHDSVKNKAVICQDCSMVFHRKCQFFVGETCFPSPHLSYFQTPTPAQSVPNLKLLAGGHDKGSRPNSRSSQAPHDRSRSATPSQMASRPTPTPPPSNQRRGSTEYRVMSPPPASSYTPRMTSPEQIVDSPSQKNSQRPPSRQEDSPNSPTLDGLRNLLSAQKRFSLGTKKSQSSIGASKLNPLPTPPASYTSTTPSMPGSRASSNTPDRSALRDSTQPMPVPILKGGSGGRAYRGKQYLPGPLDTCDEDITVRRTGQRRSSINLFSTSAPPVPVDYGQSNNYSPFQNLKHPNEDEDEFTEDHAAEMVEEDLEALLIPSIVRSPRRSIDAGHPLIEHRGKSQSIGQILDRDEYSFASSLDPTHGFGQDSQGRSTSAARPSHARSNGYHSSGSSSAAMASSSFSSHTKNNSSASSLGSVAAMLEEEDRFMKENYAGYPKNGAPSAYQASSQPPQAHHVGIKTMLSRFSNPTGVPSNDSFLGSSEQAKSSTRHQIPVPSSNFSGGRLSGLQAVHPLQSPFVKQERMYDGRAIDKDHGYGYEKVGSSVERDRLSTSQNNNNNNNNNSNNSNSNSNNNSNNEHGYSEESIPPWKRGADLVSHMGESSGLKRNGKVVRRSIGQDGRWE
ncbi:MAG: hypothetical protein BYD32DRAFT_197367 [Podila humilis]|nr:MAG: hypothetical protein BYD32DRAFT_197367 [Podila humilis]